MNVKKQMQRDYEKDLENLSIQDFQHLIDNLYIQHLKGVMRKRAKKKQ